MDLEGLGQNGRKNGVKEQSPETMMAGLVRGKISKEA